MIAPLVTSRAPNLTICAVGSVFAEPLTMLKLFGSTNMPSLALRPPSSLLSCAAVASLATAAMRQSAAAPTTSIDTFEDEAIWASHCRDAPLPEELSLETLHCADHAG